MPEQGGQRGGVSWRLIRSEPADRKAAERSPGRRQEGRHRSPHEHGASGELKGTCYVWLVFWHEEGLEVGLACKGIARTLGGSLRANRSH